MKHNIYYVIFDAGDGSVYAKFYSNEELATHIEEKQYERFAESSVSSLTIESKDSIKIEELITPEKYLINLLNDYDVSFDEDEIRYVLDTFYPKHCPEIKIHQKKNEFQVFINDVLIEEVSNYRKETLEAFSSRFENLERYRHEKTSSSDNRSTRRSSKRDY